MFTILKKLIDKINKKIELKNESKLQNWNTKWIIYGREHMHSYWFYSFEIWYLIRSLLRPLQLCCQSLHVCPMLNKNILKESRDLYINRKVKSRRLFLYFIKNFLLDVCLFNSFYVVSYKLIKHPCQVSCSTGIKKYQKSHFPGDLPCLRLS